MVCSVNRSWRVLLRMLKTGMKPSVKLLQVMLLDLVLPGDYNFEKVKDKSYKKKECVIVNSTNMDPFGSNHYYSTLIIQLLQNMLFVYTLSDLPLLFGRIKSFVCAFQNHSLLIIFVKVKVLSFG